MIDVVVLDDVLVVEGAVLEVVLVLVVVRVASQDRSSRTRHAPPFACAANTVPSDVLVTVVDPESTHASKAAHSFSPLQACMHHGYASGLLHLSAHLP
jgi:hypothetical protein